MPTLAEQNEIHTFMARVISLQYHFYTFEPIPHKHCNAIECNMRSEPTYDPSINICNRDSRNVHICTRTLCKVRILKYAHLKYHPFAILYTSFLIRFFLLKSFRLIIIPLGILSVVLQHVSSGHVRLCPDLFP